MTTQIDPLQTTALIRDTYLRYLKTIYPFQEPDLREQFWQALERPALLVKGPLLEASPPFKTGRSIERLILDRVLHPGFRNLCGDALPLARPLYLHQEQGIEKVVRGDRNVIVSTGTGSGKTETFLVPILDHLLKERAAGTLDLPGVRALLLYPMNALANDQLKRLRRVLGHYSEITFGRYTGETRETEGQAEDAFRNQFPHEPRLPNELISRAEMRAGPPHILLTNYAMLEYLLLRPQDCEFFDGPPGEHWRFLVLDEAHVYDGASGIEMAMLLRRLKDRVVRSEPGRLRCMATSATLGRGREDYPAVTRFASELFGEPFEWVDKDPARQDVVAATRLPMAAVTEVWGDGSPELYARLQGVLSSGQDSSRDIVEVLAATAEANGVPPSVVAEARQPVADSQEHEAVNHFLYLLLRGDGRLHVLQDRLAEKPCFLSDLAEDLLPGREDAAPRLIDLVACAVRARPDPDSLSLLPARYHVFARALEGAFACLDVQAHQDAENHPPRLFLTRHEECPHCGSRVVEMATCTRCGAAYVVGRISRDAEGSRCTVLRHLTGQPDDPRGEQAFFLLGSQPVRVDEDEAVITGEDLDGIPEDTAETYVLCVRCGTVTPENDSRLGCDCAPSSPRIVLRRVDLQGNTELRRCLACGSRSNSGIVYRFLTGQDAPVSVLATSLYQTLPPSTDEVMEALPGQGRKLLTFSDSRQDAAFFAPYLERTYRQVLRRRLILKTVLDDPAGREGRLRLQDVAGRLLHQAEDIGLFEQRESYDERQRHMARWLMQELIAWDRRISLEGLGLLRFRLVQPRGWRPPAPLLTPPWNLSPEEAWQLLELLLDSLRHQGAITFPREVDPRDEAFAPRNMELYIRKQDAAPAQHVFAWLPKTGSNRRLEILDRLLARNTDTPERQRRTTALEMLSNLWTHLADPRSVWREHLPSENLKGVGIVHRISHQFWEFLPLVGTETQVYRCNRCRNVSHINLRGVCPSYRCDGTLEPIDATAPAWVENHYRHLYQGMEPIPLSAEEHTAQWTSEYAASVQERFVQGELNALSCSTTFELGVDVGELQAVLMRNVPPTTANYVQRAGRAGRRTDSAALALTYAQRRSHDLTHYGRPQDLVAGRIRPPVISLTNEKIVRRHAHSVLFSAFFRWAKDECHRDFGKVGPFFEADESGTTGPDLLRQYVESYSAPVQEALRRIVPADLQDELGIEDWDWLPDLWNEEGTGILDRVVWEVREDLETLRQLEERAVARRDYRESQHFQRVARTVQSRDLLGFLGSRNVLPKYGFPTDVVELRTNHLPVEEAARVELQRDLRIAISEYAPGGEVVAAKRIWVGGGLNKQINRDWETFNYAVCPQCGRFHRSVDELEGPCTVCGANLRGWPRLYGTFVKPEFGFIVGQPPRSSGEARPRRIYSSRVYFADYQVPPGSDASADPVFEESGELSSAQVQLWHRYSRFGKMAVVNPGPMNRGFRICYTCGFAEPAPEMAIGRRRRAPGAHENPRTRESCRGRLEIRHLGHEFITDVLELRFRGLLASTVEYELWLSLLYALLEGASEALSIRRDDLDGTLYRYTYDMPPALVLYDNVPGGAGHVRRIADELPVVCQAAWERVDRCECGEETSCYECLRNFRNQPFHDQLQRGLARQFLHGLLQGAGIL